MPAKKKTTKKSESFKVSGEEAVKKIKELVKEGNIRKISIIDKQGHTVVTFPVTVGVVGAVFAPVLAAVGALAALLSECTIKVERK